MKIGRSIGTAIAAHNVLKTGVHGVSTDYVAKSTNVDQLIRNADVAAGAALAYAKLNLGLAVKNTDIALAAGIVYSKLNLALRIIDADIKGDAAIVYSKLNLTGEVLAADIEAAADIPLSKLVSAVCSEAEAVVIASIYANELTRQHFIENPATGDFAFGSSRINNGDGVDDDGTAGYASAIGQYAEVDFGRTYKIRRWRHYGSTSNNGSGSWKIEYYDGSWHDWVTGIATRATVDWSAWSDETIVSASKIRIVCTGVDTSATKSYLPELQIKFLF